MRLDIFDTKGFVTWLEPVESDQRLVSLIAHRSVLSNPDVPRPFDKREIVADWYILCRDRFVIPWMASVRSFFDSILTGWLVFKRESDEHGA